MLRPKQCSEVEPRSQGNRVLFQQLTRLVQVGLPCRIAGAVFRVFLPFPVICRHSGGGWALVQDRHARMSGGLCLPTPSGIELILERGRQAWKGADDSKMQLQLWKTRLPRSCSWRIRALASQGVEWVHSRAGNSILQEAEVIYDAQRQDGGRHSQLHAPT